MKVSNLAIKERNIPINRLYFRRNLRRRNYHSLEKGFYIAEFDCGDNPVKYLDPNGRDILIVVGDERFMQAIESLYGNSKTFKSNMDKLFSSTNANGDRLLVQFKIGPLDSNTKAIMVPENTTADHNFDTQSIDSDGNIVNSSIEKGEGIQFINITIDMEKAEGWKDLMSTISEEVMHAADATDVGSDAWNQKISDEYKTYEYSERPSEISAKERTNTVINEVYE